jgi:hypothetical protein
MGQARSHEMIQVAYYFGRYDAERGANDSTVPPELARLGVSSRPQAIELFRDNVGDGRNEATFANSLESDITYIAETLQAGGDLRPSRVEAIGSLLGASAATLWATVRNYIDSKWLQPTPSHSHTSKVSSSSSHAGRFAANPSVSSSQPEFTLPEEIPSSTTVIDGAVRTITVNAYERDPQGRERCIAAHGYACSVCNFDFGDRYGPVAAGFIHVHHLRPLSEIKEAHEVDPVSDLRPYARIVTLFSTVVFLPTALRR